MTPWLSLLVVRALLAVSSPLYWQRPDPVSPRCYVRPVLPTGHPAVFLLDKGKAIGSLSIPSSIEKTRTPVRPAPAQKQHEPLVRPPTAPRFETRRCALCQSRGEKKTDSPTHLKVANRSGFVVETLLGGAATPQGGQRAPLRGSRGTAPARLWFLSS